MAVLSPVDDTRAIFADIVCADAEWIRTEFEQIVSSLVVASTATGILPHRPDLPDQTGHGFGSMVATIGGRCAQTLVKRVRAPPHESAVPGRHC